MHFSGLHDRTQERDIEDLCSDYGKVESIKLVIDPKTGMLLLVFFFTSSQISVLIGEGESRGFAFVVMHSVAAAEKVIDNLDGRELDGRRITVAKSKRKAGRPPTPGRYLGFPRSVFQPFPFSFTLLIFLGGGGGYGRGRYERRYDDRRYDDRRYDDRYDNRRYDDRYDDRRRY